jgi:hypothetical protein
MTRSDIPLHEIRFHPLSFCDAGGRVFWWNGGLYRGITPEYASFYRALFDRGVVTRLIQDRYLIDTELTELRSPDFPMILRHRQVRFVSFANEWCPDMLAAAGRFLLDLLEVLVPQGLVLSSANPWSVLFEGCRPVLVDFCDIVPLDGDPSPDWERFTQEFHTDFIQPLELMSQGRGDLARWILADYEHQEIHTQFAEIMGYRTPNSTPRRAVRRLARLIAGRSRPGSGSSAGIARSSPQILGEIRSLGRTLDRAARPRKPNSAASPTGAPGALPLRPGPDWGPREQTVYEVLATLRPASVADLGCGAGWYARLAASLGSAVVAMDRDEGQVSLCYRAAKADDLAVLPLVMNLRYPTPGFGVSNRMVAPALQRLGADLGLALGVVHQLAIGQSLALDHVIEALASFSRRWLLIEFVPPEEAGSSPPAYSLDDLLGALSSWGRVVQIMRSSPEPRKLILCERAGSE